jgi:hypothetical protein
MPSSTIKWSDGERSRLDRLRRKYGSVRNTVMNGLRVLEQFERGQLVPAQGHTRDANGVHDERQTPAGP